MRIFDGMKIGIMPNTNNHGCTDYGTAVVVGTRSFPPMAMRETEVIATVIELHLCSSGFHLSNRAGMLAGLDVTIPMSNLHPSEDFGAEVYFGDLIWD